MSKPSLYSPFALPWFLFDMSNLQLITSKTIPMGEISDSKSIILSESPIPGQSFSPVFGAGMGNRKISFTLPIVNKNNNVGNMLLLKQFENLRNQAFGLNLQSILSAGVQYQTNPKVLYYWGTGAGAPIEWFVSKCDFKHKSSLVGPYAYPQYTEVEIELILDEQSWITQAEGMFRKIASYAGIFQGLGLI